MTDDLDRRLHDSLAGLPLPAAPPTILAVHSSLVRLPSRRRRRRFPLLVAAATFVLAAIAFVGVYLIASGGSAQSEPPPAPTPSATPTSSPSPSPSPTLATVDGLPIYEVGELLAVLDGPERPSGPIALRGFWTDRTIAHTCAFVPHSETNLEGYCHDGEYGITEANAPIVTWLPGGRMEPTDGPWLTPWIPKEFEERLFLLPFVNDQQYTPVPIVVVGHIDDPRAAECAPNVRPVCFDRFVIDRIVAFDPASVPPPTPTPVPSPFPFDNPPPARFGEDMCPADDYTFVGWTTLNDLGVTDRGEQVVFAMVTKEPVPVGDEAWLPDPDGSSHRWRRVARRICFAYEWEQGGVGFVVIPGTESVEWDDGRHTPVEP